MNILDALLGALTGAGAVAFCVFMLRESLKAGLSRSVQRDVEAHKQQLQVLTEEAKQRLQILTEMARHDLQREAIKAEVATPKTHEVYATAFGALRRAHSALWANWVGGMHLFESEMYATEDLERILRMTRAPEGEKRRVRAELRANRSMGAESLRQLVRREEHRRMRLLVSKARQLVAFKALYMSVPVRELAAEIGLRLAEVFDHVHSGDTNTPVRELWSTQDAALQRLESLMRAELQPRELPGPAAT